MPTLLAAYNRKHELVGRCDARCYDGTGERCRCICGRINHAVGLQTAARQTLALTTIDPEGLYTPTPADQITIEKSKHLSKWAHPTFNFPE